MSLKEFRSKLKMKDAKIYSYIINNELKMEEIIQEYTNYIYTIIKNYNTNLSNEDIEEITLDVFFTLWKNQFKLDINKSLSSYIGGITKNLIKYKCRQNKLALNIDDFDGELQDFNNIELFLIQDEKKQIIKKELEKIKIEERQVFIMYYYNNTSIKEISKQLNISNSKVKIILFRTRKRIKRALKERGYDSNE